MGFFHWRKPSPECSAAPQAPPWPRAQSPRTAQQERCRAARVIGCPLVLPLHQPRPPLRGPGVPAGCRACTGFASASSACWSTAASASCAEFRACSGSRRSMGGRVFSSPVAGFSMTHIKGSKCAMISRALSTSRTRLWRVSPWQLA